MTEKKLAEIERLSLGGTTSIARLIELSNDSEEEVRFRSVEALGILTATAESKARIKDALLDPDDLVRTAAVEVLGIWKADEAANLLMEAIDDPSEIVRSAAIVSLGEIGSKRSIWILERRYREQVGSDAERLSCAVALYNLGLATYLDQALGFLDHECYQLRCAVANLLRDFTATNDIPVVLGRLRSAVKAESTEAARSSLLSAIEALAGPS